MVEFEEMGGGLAVAVAVLLDATVVRALLLPATMKLLGRYNWYLPRWPPRQPVTGGLNRPGPSTGPTAFGAQSPQVQGQRKGWCR